MGFTKEQLAAILRRRLPEIPGYQDAFRIASMNSEGEIWLIGGIVSRVLIEEVYGIPQEEFDFDFLVKEVKEHIDVPAGWELLRKKHGNPTFVKGELEVDLFPIATHNFIKCRGLEPTIENFFKGVPFTIQAMAFNVATGELAGDVGIAAFNNREYAVNNMEEAQAMACRKGITVNQRILQKAKSLGLRPVLVK